MATPTSAADTANPSYATVTATPTPVTVTAIPTSAANTWTTSTAESRVLKFQSHRAHGVLM